MSATLDPPKSLYEREVLEEDLWFLPGPPQNSAPTDPPWGIVDRTPLFTPKDWLKAEAGLGRELARAAAAFAALDERLRGSPKGLGQRLALQEITGMIWVMGARIPVERIALYEVLRLSSTGDDVRELSAASWGLRRLASGQRAAVGFTAGSPEDLRVFLGRRSIGEDGFDDHGAHPVGESFDALAGDWLDVQAYIIEAHALTRAAAAFFSWRAFGLSGSGEVLEPAVVAARVGAEEGRGGLSFLPLATVDFGVYLSGGTTAEKLARWYRAAENACLRALLQLDRLEDWQARAGEVVSDLSGKTPPKLIEALSAAPVLSADMAADLTRVSKAASLRNLMLFENRDLIREVTGQGRYRFWAAKL